MYKRILYTVQSLNLKKQIMPKEVLGRSLAYNCFLPRLSNTTFLQENLKHTKEPLYALYTNAKILDVSIQKKYLNVNFDKAYSCVFFNDYDLIDGQKYTENIDYLSMIRRMMPAFVVHDSIFIDEYQILESAISGSDMIVIDMQYLNKYVELLYILENKPEFLNCDIKIISSQIDFITKKCNTINNKHKKTNSLKSHMDKLMMFAYNLGIIPIVRVYGDKDLSLLHILENFPICIYADCNIAKFTLKDNIIFANANMFKTGGLNSNNIDVFVFNN